MTEVVIVTRHKALVEYLNKLGINGEVIEHASVNDIKGKVVYGVLPYSLACETERFFEVSMVIPFEFRGKELSLNDIESFKPTLTEYKVVKL